VSLQISKSRAIAAGALALVAGFVVYSEMNGRDAEAGRGARREQGRDAARGSASARPKVAKGCPGEVTVEDPSIKVSPEYIKGRFSTKTCSRTSAGEVNACMDADEEACKKRLAGIARMMKNPGECLNRPAELYCSVHKLDDDRATTACFETKQLCDTYHERKRGQPRICRTAPSCELVTLPPV
jgi:hypothetical protein